MDATVNFNPGPARAIISLQQWLADVGVTACTAWRWRKKGWLKTVNIYGRQYLTQEAIEEFTRRAAAGEFAQEHKVPARHREAGVTDHFKTSHSGSNQNQPL